jgi:RNA polymerase sigma-70 factor (ECF subfamily)
MSNRVALAELIDRHYVLVYRYAYRLCGSSTEAEDLTQQTFLQAQVKSDQLREPAAARNWLCAIVRNAYLHSVRRVMRPIPLDAAPEPCTTPASPLEIDPETLQEALNELPEEFRTAVVLFYFREFTYKQIAAQLNVPIGTVMSRLARGKEQLRRRLAPEDLPVRERPPRAPRVVQTSGR